jgi:periplasmic divalent cation tolerance protein
MDDHLLVLSTCPDNATAERLATMLVEQRLAACVNVLPGLTSVYRWQGEIQRDSEVLLLAKSRADRYPELESALVEHQVEHHPYELPEVVAVSLEQGLEGYLAWLDRALGDTE